LTKYFQPLGNARSTFLSATAASFSFGLGCGLSVSKGNFKAVPYLYLNIAPAAALQTTATDMAHFMIAERAYKENSRILEEMLAGMATLYQASLLPGATYRFHERLENNIRAIEHLERFAGYSSSLTLHRPKYWDLYCN